MMGPWVGGESGTERRDRLCKHFQRAIHGTRAAFGQALWTNRTSRQTYLIAQDGRDPLRVPI